MGNTRYDLGEVGCPVDGMEAALERLRALFGEVLRFVAGRTSLLWSGTFRVGGAASDD